MRGKIPVFALLIAFMVVGLTAEVEAALDLSRLLLYWPCDEGSGDKLGDKSGHGWDATIKGGKSSWEEGIFGKAIRLQLAYAQVDGNIIESTGDTGEITIMTWFKMDQHITYDGLVSIEAPEGDCCEYRLMVNPGFNPFWNCGHHADKSLAGFTFELKKWYHYALTGDGKSGKIYVDGAFIGEQVENFKLPKFKQVTVYLGTGESPGTWPVEDATFDEVMIWDKALSNEEIKEVMDGKHLAVELRNKLAVTWGEVKSRLR